MSTPSVRTAAEQAAANHERRAEEHRQWAAAYDAIADAISGIRCRAEGDGSSRQFTTTLRDEQGRANEEYERLEAKARYHEQLAAAIREMA